MSETARVSGMSRPDATSPRRRGDHDSTPGRCTNLDYCSIGTQRMLVDVPVNAPFVCPECGSKLRPPTDGGRSLRWVMPAIRIGILLAGIGLGTGMGYVMGRAQPKIKVAVATASHDTVQKVNAARALLGLSNLAPEAVRIEPPAPTAAVPTPPPAPAAPPFMVTARPYPRRAPSLDSEDPPQRLAEEQRAGQVVIDCTLDPIQAKPRCRATSIHGANAFSAAAIGWLEGFAVQYPPGVRNGASLPLTHRWRVIFEDFAGTAAQARPQAARRR